MSCIVSYLRQLIDCLYGLLLLEGVVLNGLRLGLMSTRILWVRGGGGGGCPTPCVCGSMWMAIDALGPLLYITGSPIRQ